MIKRIFQISIAMACMVMVLSGCKKDTSHPDKPGNPSSPYNDKTSAVFNATKTYETVTDKEGNVYKTITIGNQTWMAENLRSTKYNDGTDIPNITSDSLWSIATTAAYSNYSNKTNIDSIATYGRLYNWYAVNSGKLAPEGWHIPSDSEMTILSTYLGGDSVAGGKLKEAGTKHWLSPNTNATNESGMTAMPSGGRNNFGVFINIGKNGYLWTSSAYSTTTAWLCNLTFDKQEAGRVHYDKSDGVSVRCVKD